MSIATLTRRQIMGMAGAAAMLPRTLSARTERSPTITRRPRTAQTPEPYSADVLPASIRSRFVHNVNGLRMHVLEAGFETPGRDGVFLVHGFPELAYSWRHVMPHLADAGYHVIAPDLRGYGRTDGTDVRYDDDLRPFRMMNEIRDMLALVAAFGYRNVALVGHDFGSLVASWCAVARPDVFRSVVLMSAPFAGTATLPFDTADSPPDANADDTGSDMDEDLASLDPSRKHYRRYYATRQANEDMWRGADGVHAFLRGYYHMKSADWPGNQPSPLAEWSAHELAKLPHYYVMERDKGMDQTVASEMPSPDEIAACKWLPDHELRVYSDEYERTGFQGGLQWYRSNGSVSSLFDAGINADLQVFAGRTLDQPSLFVAGRSDWGIYQRPHALEQMTSACTDLRGLHLLPGAGHWVQQEQSAAVTTLLLEFLEQV